MSNLTGDTGIQYGGGIGRVTNPDGGVFSVYRFYNEASDCIYVGVTGRALNRLKQHSSKQTWWAEVVAIGVEHFDDRLIACEREKHLITSLTPRYNGEAGLYALPRPPIVPPAPERAA